MFKKDKRSAESTSTFFNGSSSPSAERKDKAPTPTPSNFDGTNKEVASASSQSTTAPMSWDTLDPFTVFDASPNSATTAKSPTVARQSKPVVSSSTLQSTALQAPFKRGAQSASTAADQILANKREATHIIANYAVEPLEMLHLVDRWLQQLLDEFLQQRDHFKYRLGEKWQNQELTNIKYDNNNDRIRKINDVYKELERARDTILSHESFDELNKYLRTVDNTTRNEIKEKFNLLLKDYSRILQCLQFVDKETKTDSAYNSINDIKKNLLKLKELNNKQSHTICIVGLEKAGKSTFINALLGYELLPTASQRCTQIRTVLKPTLDDGDQKLFAIVSFYDHQEFRVFFDKMTKKTDETQQQLDHHKGKVIEEREILKAKFPEQHFYITGRIDENRERADIIDQLHKYITGEVYVNIIKEIAIYTDRLPGKNYELLDVPGFDSPIKEHRDAGLQAIRTADAFLFLTNGQQPSLTQPQIRLLHEIQENHFEAMQRAFGIITKLDLCQTPQIYQDHSDKACNELIEKNFKPEHIYIACPRLQIIDRHSEEFRIIDEKIHSFSDDLAQGFERSKDGLENFIEYELPKTHLKQLIDLGRMRLVRHVLERLEKIKEKQLLPQKLDISIDEYIKQQNIESWDQIYYEHIFQPAFAKANHWHTTTVTKERTQFVENVKLKFHHSFLDLTKDFIKETHEIEKLIFETHGYTKLQLNAHPTDNQVREKLCIELEKIVDKASNILAEHFYDRYICELENMLNDICPQLKDLYRTKLTLEKCRNETHALILRVCRPVIMATLRYSHIDSAVKQDAINELIYIAPMVVFNIASASDKNNDGGMISTEISKSVESLSSTNDMTTALIKTLFKK